MVDCLISPVKEISKRILTHFYYWWCFDNNIQCLKGEVRELDRQIYGLQQNIEEARLGAEVVRPGVDEWLKANTKMLEEARRILPDDNIPKASNLLSRYSFGKNAKKTAEEITKLRDDGNFSGIYYTPAAMASPPPTSTRDFESREGIEDEIINSLKQSSVGIIGICGMLGVGKRTMAERIGNRVLAEKLFEEVVMVNTGLTIDIPKIQEEIAELLGLKLYEESIAARADQLRKRLMDEKRKIIILAEVWDDKRLNFEELGIPIINNFQRCKVLLTSPSLEVCKRIKCKKIFQLTILEKDEAWILFKDKVGICLEESALHEVARKVVEECKGLPITLVTVGLGLKDETEIEKWDAALEKLKRSNRPDVPELFRDVYMWLKVSYDSLNNDSERYLFLMCCLFREDYHIPIEQLTWYSMGLGLFYDITNIEKARNQTHSLVETLKSRCLLIAGGDKLHVKMDDVVRIVAVYIGSRENGIFLKSLSSIKNPSDVNCKWMSVDISNEPMEVPALSRFPNLRLLLLSSNKFYDISHMSFEGVENLNVLSFEGISNGSLPPTLGLLKKLQTLRLVNCKVENISVVGELTSLKIFCCSRCPNITELPAEIGRLKRLRLLELSKCQLRRIPFDIIASLSQLEELKISRSF